jgi:ABC-2 type transport system permease protein
MTDGIERHLPQLAIGRGGEGRRGIARATRLTGTGMLIRLILRRDRVLLPLWVVMLAVVPAGYAAGDKGLFPAAADRLHYYDISVHNAAFVALYGPLAGSGLGALVAGRSGFVPVVVALLSLLTVIRHTRMEEEAGRTELIGAAATGRHAQLAAALTVTYAANLVLGLILAATMIGQGLPAAGSFALGAEFALAGWAFTAVAAVTAQVAGGARGARAIGIAVLAVAWVLRLAGDISAIGTGGAAWLSWLSPIGWAQHIFPYAGDRRWPIVLVLLFTVLATGLGVVLLGRRDIGAGLLPARPGPATAAPGLRSAFALAWRLHRGLVAGWTIGFAALGLVFGAVASSVAELSDENSGLTDIFTRLGGTSEITGAYFGAVGGMLGLIAAGYGVQATLRLRDEEVAGHAETLLTDSVGRLRWVAGHLVFALLGPAVALAVAGLGEGLVHGDVTGLIGGALAELPAVWVLTAVAVLLFGVLPRASALAWGPLAICVLMLLVGQTLRLDQWVLDVSPFTHISHLPTVNAAPLVVLTLVSIAVGAAGLASFRRRDVTP